MTSSTPDKVVGSIFKTVLVNEFWEQVVWPESWPAITAPVMWWAGTTTVANIGTTTADLWGTYTSDGWSPITATWFVLYPAGNPSTIIWGSGVTDFPDATLPSPITASATGLTAWANYCFKPLCNQCNRYKLLNRAMLYNWCW